MIENKACESSDGLVGCSPSPLRHEADMYFARATAKSAPETEKPECALHHTAARLARHVQLPDVLVLRLRATQTETEAQALGGDLDIVKHKVSETFKRPIQCYLMNRK